uniref:G-protein coupled receptors family 1 profile domain-containing protein n=1 Tax=Xenopus tropicalis TaxID=8364 RepID=A0A803J8M3_XENTR
MLIILQYGGTLWKISGRINMIMFIKYLYCALALLGFLMILLASGSVIAAVLLNKSLQEPMYIFVCVLCANGIYGSVGFFPSLFVNLIGETQTITYIGCLIQMFCIHTYTAAEMSILALMAFDRYLCICNPLRYNGIMTLAVAYKLIVAAWLFVLIPFTIHFILTILLPLCGSSIVKIYCDNYSLVKLSCVDTTVNNIYVASYIQILRVCARSSMDFRKKSLQTCTPHLISLTNYVADILFEVLLHRFTLKNLPYELRIIMSVQAFPVLNPLIYGLKLKKIKTKMIQFFFQKTYGSER